MTPEAPRTNADVQARYRELHAAHQTTHQSMAFSRTTLLRIMLLFVALLVYETYQSLHGHAAVWIFAVAFAGIGTLLWMAVGRQGKLAHQHRLLSFYERALARSDGTQPQSGRTGLEMGLEAGQNLRPAGHLYDRDLDLLGPDSLFKLLATVRTGPGERGLARFLLDPATHAETVLRQQAVKELLPQTALREQIALLGATSFHQISASFFDDWLADPAPSFPSAVRPALIVTALANVALLLSGFTHLRPWSDVLPNLFLTLAAQGLLCLWLRKRVLPLLQGGARLEANVRLLSAGLALLQRSTFSCSRLQSLQRAAREPAGAVKTLKQLTSALSIVEQRPKEYFFLFSLLLAAGTQAAISIAHWKRLHAPAMQAWLDAWAEFEALNAIATYAFEHPVDDLEYTWPQLLPADHPTLYEARTLRHPLLPAAIPNDISLSVPNHEDPTKPAQFFLISGSNMSGKSTLLRAIGINAVLAYAGAPVRASSLRLTPFRIGAALALTDSLAEGRSRFQAEVERLSAIVTLSTSAPVLFLVDEIFSGTNSADRRTAAGAVLARLLGNGAIGALSTHDLALTELATPENAGRNVHMASPNPEDPLAFDYLLKPGINTTTNALAIIRLLGL